MSKSAIGDVLATAARASAISLIELGTAISQSLVAAKLSSQEREMLHQAAVRGATAGRRVAEVFNGLE